MPRRRVVTLEEAKRMTQEEIDEFVSNFDSTKIMWPHKEDEDREPWSTD